MYLKLFDIFALSKNNHAGHYLKHYKVKYFKLTKNIRDSHYNVSKDTVVNAKNNSSQYLYQSTSDMLAGLILLNPLVLSTGMKPNAT